MPFDSFMMAALAKELSQRLVGVKVDRICQPERDEIDLLFNFQSRSRLIINCTASTPFLALSDQPRENPETPPMMCMLLRKHLSRAKITSVEQIGFDRILRISFDSGDEMGFRKSKYLFCEMMGRGSNLIFTDENLIILAAFRQNDITTKFSRLVMVGMPYQPMPVQDRMDPIAIDQKEFFDLVQSCENMRGDSFLQKYFFGFGKLTAREIVFLASGDPETLLSDMNPNSFAKAFFSVTDLVRKGEFKPCLIYDKRDISEDTAPFDFSFFPITQFGEEFSVLPCASASEAIEQYYLLRNREERNKQHYNDIAQILKNCSSRLEKKIFAQMQQLEDAKDADEVRLKGDLIMQDIYRIQKGDSFVSVMNYSTEPFREISIELDPRLSPSQNAQAYYRKYTKKKTALVKIQEQIDVAREELRYAESVMATLRTATSMSDLREIREELSHWNYGRRLTSALKKPHARKTKVKPRETKSPNQFVVFVGMNHLQNDAVSTDLASKEDLWFHVKNYHGSHVLLKGIKGIPFENEDIEFAASLAAYYSEVSESDRVEVDCAPAKNVKKPSGSKPGFVTYKNYKTLIVSPRKMK